MLTSAQLQTLKAAILADPTLNAFANGSDGNFDLAVKLSTTLASPTFFVYRTNVPPQEIFDQIAWANLTPNDAPDTTQQWANRSLECQGKQFNLQILVQGQTAVNAARANVRAGLQDALTNVPSGAGGSIVSAGWVGIRDNVLGRSATRIEKILATTTVQQDGSTMAKSATMTYEGTISSVDVQAARNS
jgi:hypothetical protein